MATLTTAQMQALKAYILADPVLVTKTSGSGTDYGFIANALNTLTAAPAFIVWKLSVTIGEVGKSFNASELAGLTSLNNTRLQTLAIYLQDGINPTLASVRQFFDDIFSGAGGASTRAALLALWKRTATVAEKVLATGTGSDASPATLNWEGSIALTDIPWILAS